MNILVVLSRVPYPLDKGDKLRAFHQLKHLSQSHRISLFCLNEGQIHPKAIEELKKICDHVEVVQFSKLQLLLNLAKGLFNSLPFQVNYFHSASAQKTFDRFLEQNIPDVIYCQLVRTSEYVIKYRTLTKYIDYMDAFSSAMERRLSSVSALWKVIIKAELQRLKNYEKQVLQFFNGGSIISKQDKVSINLKGADLNVIPNGVDFDYFTKEETKKDVDILFVGNMNYPPNIEAAERLVKEIVPKIEAHLGSIKVMIAGTSPHVRVKKLAAKNIIVTGFIPDIRDAYNRSKVFVAPLKLGAGLQNKLLEAMSMEIPCVTSELANNAINADNKTIIAVTEDIDFSSQVLDLLQDESKRLEMGKKGRKLIIDKFSWQANNVLLNQMLQGE